MRAQILAAFAAFGMLLGGSGTAAAQAVTNPQGTAFTRSLAEEYKALALRQRSEGDPEGAALFDRKADKAAAGTIVPPEDPASYRLGDAAANAAGLHGSVIDLVNEQRDSMTSSAAKAQVNFDCWVYRLGEYERRDKAASCRAAFMAAFEELLQHSPRNGSAGPPVGDTSTIYFDFDRTAVTWRGRQVIDQQLAEYRAVPPYAVEVVGYTDTAGSAVYNLALGLRRANAVRDALIAGGVPASIISVSSKGMSDPAVATGPNVKDARNRRVEITPKL